jgi:hypothetical protein
MGLIAPHHTRKDRRKNGSSRTSCAPAASSSASYEGCAPGPGGPSGSHPGRRSRSLRSLRKVVCGPARRAFVPRLARRAFCPLRVLPPRGPCPWARPRRGGPPAAFLRPRRLRPGLPRSAAACGLSPSAGARWPRGPCRPIRSGAGSLRSPFLRSGAAVGLPWPRPFLSPPPSGLRVRPSSLRSSAAAPAPGRWGGLRRPLGRFAARGPLVLAGPARLRCAPRRGCCGGRWALPCAPPPRRPRWGLRVARCPLGGFAPPLRGSAFCRPSCVPPSPFGRSLVRRFWCG